MADTIRERIIQAFMAKAAEITIAYGYNTECGANVQRAAFRIHIDNLPAVNIVPRPDELPSRDYGRQVAVMPMDVQAIQVHGESKPSVIGEQALGDLISCMMGTERVLAFTSGGPYVVAVGDTVAGGTGGATARVVSITLSSGSWAAGTAAGTFRFRMQTGTFQAENLNVGTNFNVATIAGNSIEQAGKVATGAGLIDDIEYAGGGIDDYPSLQQPETSVTVTFNVKYSTLLGNPYSQ